MSAALRDAMQVAIRGQRRGEIARVEIEISLPA